MAGEPDGSHTLEAPGPARYRIGFRFIGGGSHPPKFWEDAPSLKRAADVQLSSSEEVGGVDSRLAPLGSFSGLVTNASPRPVAGLPITIGGIVGEATTTPGGVRGATIADARAEEARSASERRRTFS